MIKIKETKKIVFDLEKFKKWFNNHEIREIEQEDEPGNYLHHGFTNEGKIILYHNLSFGPLPPEHHEYIELEGKIINL